MEFGTGDLVRIVGYGALMWEYKDGKPVATDIMPEIVGKIAMVMDSSMTQGKEQYVLEAAGLNKTAWYDADQLQLVVQNKNYVKSK